MSFWSRIQEDLKKNLQEGIEIFKEGSSVVTEKIEKLTGEGKKKYRSFNLNMKVQEEFSALGGTVYDLIARKSKNPLANSTVKSIIARINKLEAEISSLDEKEANKPVKKAGRTTARKTARKGTRKKSTPSPTKTRAARTRTVKSRET